MYIPHICDLNQLSSLTCQPCQNIVNSILYDYLQHNYHAKVSTLVNSRSTKTAFPGPTELHHDPDKVQTGVFETGNAVVEQGHTLSVI